MDKKNEELNNKEKITSINFSSIESQSINSIENLLTMQS